MSNTNVNLWKNSTSVIDWLKAINNKSQCTFFVFHIESFYPSILLDLFEKELNFAKQITPIVEINLRIMMHSIKTLLFHGSGPFIKREGYENFNVPMKCFDGLEVCELVGTYILSQLNTLFQNENVLTEMMDLEFLEIFQDQKLKEREKQLSVYLKNVGYQ